MQDRYLFRGKRTDNKEWVYGGLVIAEEKHSFGENGMFSDCFIVKKERLRIDSFVHGNEVWTHNKFIQVDPATVGQCTGRKDDSAEPKNIFDGDILLGQWQESASEYGGLENYSDEGTVSWDEEWGKWIVTDSADTHDLYDWCEKAFVIGNVHDKEGENV